MSRKQYMYLKDPDLERILRERERKKKRISKNLDNNFILIKSHEKQNDCKTWERMNTKSLSYKDVNDGK